MLSPATPQPLLQAVRDEARCGRLAVALAFMLLRWLRWRLCSAATLRALLVVGRTWRGIRADALVRAHLRHSDRSSLPLASSAHLAEVAALLVVLLPTHADLSSLLPSGATRVWVAGQLRCAGEESQFDCLTDWQRAPVQRFPLFNLFPPSCACCQWWTADCHSILASCAANFPVSLTSLATAYCWLLVTALHGVTHGLSDRVQTIV